MIGAVGPTICGVRATDGELAMTVWR